MCTYVTPHPTPILSLYRLSLTYRHTYTLKHKQTNKYKNSIIKSLDWKKNILEKNTIIKWPILPLSRSSTKREQMTKLMSRNKWRWVVQLLISRVTKAITNFNQGVKKWVSLNLVIWFHDFNVVVDLVFSSSSFSCYFIILCYPVGTNWYSVWHEHKDEDNG